MKQADADFKVLTQLIQFEVTGRLVTTAYNCPVNQFMVKEYEMNTGHIILRRLFDPNEIALMPDNRFSDNFRMIRNSEEFFRDFQFMSADQEKSLRRALLTTDNHVFIVKYTVKVLDGQRECITKEILPKGLGSLTNIQMDYNILFHPVTKEITNVVSRKYGNIIYRAIRVDDESGFVLGSVVKLWTVQPAKDLLNIIHIHLNDTSDEATVDVSCLTSELDVLLIDENDFSGQEFKKDVSGKPLRYKILVYQNKVKTVLYNTGTSIEVVKFQEFRIEHPTSAKPQYVNV